MHMADIQESALEEPPVFMACVHGLRECELKQNRQDEGRSTYSAMNILTDTNFFILLQPSFILDISHAEQLILFDLQRSQRPPCQLPQPPDPSDSRRDPRRNLVRYTAG